MTHVLSILFAAGKLGKVAASGATMIISVFAYALVFGPWYAAGLALLVGTHALAHRAALRRQGRGGPTPGAGRGGGEERHMALSAARAGLAGPLAGTAAALTCFALARHRESDLLLALAFAGFLLSLLPLIPLAPLAGGRITAMVSPRLWLLGVPLLGALFAWRPGPMPMLLMIVAIPQIPAALRREASAPAGPAGGAAPPAPGRLRLGAAYLALTTFLALMTGEAHELLLALRGRATGDAL